MLVALLILTLVDCVALFAALRPKEYARYFFSESQRRAMSDDFKALSLIGGAIFCLCMAFTVALTLQGRWNLLAPVLWPVLHLVCAVAYSWWGVWLLRHPESLLKRANGQWSRIPARFIRAFGLLLLLGAAGFLYDFAIKIERLVR